MPAAIDREYPDHVLIDRVDQLAQRQDLSMIIQFKREITALLQQHQYQFNDLTAKLGAQERIHKELSQVCSALKIERETLLATIKELRDAGKQEARPEGAPREQA